MYVCIYVSSELFLTLVHSTPRFEKDETYATEHSTCKFIEILRTRVSQGSESSRDKQLLGLRALPCTVTLLLLNQSHKSRSFDRPFSKKYRTWYFLFLLPHIYKIVCKFDRLIDYATKNVVKIIIDSEKSFTLPSKLNDFSGNKF